MEGGEEDLLTSISEQLKAGEDSEEEDEPNLKYFGTMEYYGKMQNENALLK